MILQEKISQLYHQNIPFVAYRNPFEEQVHVLIQKNNNIYEWNGQDGFCFVDFNCQKALVIPIEASEKMIYDIKLKSKIIEHTSLHENQDNEKKFKQLVNKAIDVIKHHDFEKIVVSRVIDTNINSSIEQLTKNLFNNFEETFTYIFFQPKIGCWIGATPELLLKKQGNHYKTVALAGTISGLANGQQQFTEKERIEQAKINDYFDFQLQNKIKNIKVSDTEIIKTGMVQHLITSIEFELNQNLTSIQLLNILHPTPAVAGIPKQQSIDWINQNEINKRLYYSGFLGMYQNDFSLFVNLRCMQWLPNEQKVFVGCGILEQSDADKEWIETQAKAQTMLGLLNMSKND